MVEKRSERLKIVVELAQRAEDEVASRFDKAKNSLENEVKMLHDIETYYADYETRFRRETQSIKAAQLMQSRDFLNRLSEAQKGQEGLVRQAEQVLEEVKQEWHKVHLKHQALKDLVEQYKKQEYLVIEKIEQKYLDDWVTQQH